MSTLNSVADDSDSSMDIYAFVTRKSLPKDPQELTQVFIADSAKSLAVRSFNAFLSRETSDDRFTEGECRRWARGMRRSVREAASNELTARAERRAETEGWEALADTAQWALEVVWAEVEDKEVEVRGRMGYQLRSDHEVEGWGEWVSLEARQSTKRLPLMDVDDDEAEAEDKEEEEPDEHEQRAATFLLKSALSGNITRRTTLPQLLRETEMKEKDDKWSNLLESIHAPPKDVKEDKWLNVIKSAKEHKDAQPDDVTQGEAADWSEVERDSDDASDAVAGTAKKVEALDLDDDDDDDDVGDGHSEAGNA